VNSLLALSLLLSGWQAPPGAQFFGSPIVGPQPLTVNFTNLSSGATSYAWDFGDGGTSLDTHPAHVFATYGSYTITLTASGPGGTDVETKSAYITVNPPAPTANFSATPLEGFAPLAVQFTDLSTAPVASWSWDFGDGSTSTLQHPTHTYTTRGNFSVRLTATGPGGADTETVSGLVHVRGQKTRPRTLPRKNIVLVILDDVGVERIGAYGEGPAGVLPPCTPNLDALAAEGVLFRHAYASPVCSPTRAQILTGRHGFRTGIGDLVTFTGTASGLSTELETLLPRILAGYSTSTVGKWHLAHPTQNGLTHPLDSGFGFFAGSLYNLGTNGIACGDDCTPPDCSALGTLGYYNWVKTYSPWNNQELVQECVTTYATTDTTDDAIARAQAMPQPFFLQVSFNAPHLPYDLPPTHLCPPNGTCTLQYCQSGNVTSAEMANAIMEALDSEFGRMVAAIRAVDPETVFFVISDNGTSESAALGTAGDCFDPARSKGTVYEGGIRVPLLAAGGGIVPGECAALVCATDLFGTIADLAGVHWSAEDSISLAPYLAGNMTPLRTTVYAEEFSPNFISPDVNGQPPFEPTVHTRAIRNERYKLIRFTTSTGAQEELFFDLESDPCETVNLCPGFGNCTGAGMNAQELASLQALRDELAAMGVY
jgi:PKD repeat protein